MKTTLWKYTKLIPRTQLSLAAGVSSYAWTNAWSHSLFNYGPKPRYENIGWRVDAFYHRRSFHLIPWYQWARLSSSEDPWECVISNNIYKLFIRNLMSRKKGKLGAHAIKRIATGAHLPIPWLFELLFLVSRRQSRQIEIASLPGWHSCFECPG